MVIDAEFTLKIKLNDLIVPSNISGFELKQRITEEGEKRMRYVASGYLKDPEGKVINKEVTYQIKEN